jgi:hypothetical protein
MECLVEYCYTRKVLKIEWLNGTGRVVGTATTIRTAAGSVRRRSQHVRW